MVSCLVVMTETEASGQGTAGLAVDREGRGGSRWTSWVIFSAVSFCGEQMEEAKWSKYAPECSCYLDWSREDLVTTWSHDAAVPIVACTIWFLQTALGLFSISSFPSLITVIVCSLIPFLFQSLIKYLKIMHVGNAQGRCMQISSALHPSPR